MWRGAPNVTTETWPKLRPDVIDGDVDLERDRELVEIAQAGDKAAFDVLYACYSAAWSGTASAG